ncbi:MAG: hypothetical protein RL885_01790 [Planctomycetota bacterium]
MIHRGRSRRVGRFGQGAFLIAGLWTVFLAASCRSHQIEQTYYLGVFDPIEQVPPTIYRVRVTGTSDFFSTVNYAAGWVPADLIDSLGSRITFDREKGELQFGHDGESQNFGLKTGRGLMLFGPEGFREAPRDHRLAIIMDSDPSAFFEAIDTALGQLSAAKALQEQTVSSQSGKILERIVELVEETEQLESIDLLDDSKEEGQ